MQATKENQQCEITWVVVGDRYYTRVVDVIDNGNLKYACFDLHR
jgi:hypothetical protein